MLNPLLFQHKNAAKSMEKFLLMTDLSRPLNKLLKTLFLAETNLFFLYLVVILKKIPQIKLCFK